MRDAFLEPARHADDVAGRARRLRGRLADPAHHAPTPRTSSSSTASSTRSSPVDQARLFVAELRRTSKKSVVYAELPGAQHAFDVFHSIRSAHAVRAVDRYLTWHWNTWRHGLEADSGVEPEELDDAAARLSPG